MSIEREIIENLLQNLEGAANFMRGMTLDRAIPPHARAALQSRIEKIDGLVEQVLESLESIDSTTAREDV
jgi:vacuolar-type H+-ATPase subunit E/Vma4